VISTCGPRRSSTMLVVLLCVMFPATGWTWGWATHHYIAQNYSQHLPAYMDGLQVYDGVVDDKVTDADARRGSTPGEAERHYIDIDFYPEFLQGTLSHDRSVLEAQYGAATVIDVGILPWAVGEVTATLAEQFEAGQWSDAAITIADLCHYVGDATQPLHCTENYNGQLTGNYGIHSRYETTMIGEHIGDLFTPPGTVTYYANAVDAMFDLISTSWTGVSAILQADDNARAVSGESYNSTYYSMLWSDTETMTRERVNAASLATASFVYTAWVDAGRPEVPGSSVSVPPPAILVMQLFAGPSPFRDALTIRYVGPGPLRLDVFDARGSRVDRLVDGASGEGSISWRPSARLGAGIYFVRLSGPQGELVRRVVWLD